MRSLAIVLSKGIEPLLTPWKGAVLPLDEESKIKVSNTLSHFILTTLNTTTLLPSDPLEQFEIVSLVRFFKVTLLNSIAVTWAALLSLFTLALALYSLKSTNNYAYVVRSLYQLVCSIVRENLYIRKQQYFTVLFYLFGMLLLANLVGLLPFSFTATSSFVVTLFLALTHFLGVNLIGVTRHQWELNNLFLPSGAPLVIAPFLILIEAVSYGARALSLSIRLFANMMSGHALLKILIGFSWIMISSGSMMIVLALVPWVIVTAVMFLELLIAFLQSYVFTILVSLYINDVLTFHD
jgi:ATP synthase subunit 6